MTSYTRPTMQSLETMTAASCLDSLDISDSSEGLAQAVTARHGPSTAAAVIHENRSPLHIRATCQRRKIRAEMAVDGGLRLRATAPLARTVTVTHRGPLQLSEPCHHLVTASASQQ